METNEKKYEKMINDLKNLQKVKAPANFEADLMRRINAGKFKPEEKSSWEKLFLPSRLIPSLSLATAAIVVFLVVNVNSEEMDNPFLIEPRLREDVIEITGPESIEVNREEPKKEKTIVRKDKVDEETAKDLKPTEDKSLAGRDEMQETETMVEQPTLVTEEKSIAPETSLTKSTFAETTNEFETTVTADEMATGLAITKEELNFRQVQLSEEEQQEVKELKMKVQSLQNIKTDENVK